VTRKERRLSLCRPDTRAGDILAAARAAQRIITATDLLIIATAAATGRVLHTRDRRQATLAQAAGVPLQAGI
jgi:predicted nucleic acid-binding protein